MYNFFGTHFQEKVHFAMIFFFSISNLKPWLQISGFAAFLCFSLAPQLGHSHSQSFLATTQHDRDQRKSK